MIALANLPATELSPAALQIDLERNAASRDQAGLGRLTRTFEATYGNLKNVLHGFVARIRQGEIDDYAGAVSALLEYEKQWAKQYKKTLLDLELLKKNRFGTVMAARARKELIASLEAMSAHELDLLETFRDYRWQLMAAKASKTDGSTAGIRLFSAPPA